MGKTTLTYLLEPLDKKDLSFWPRGYIRQSVVTKITAKQIKNSSFTEIGSYKHLNNVSEKREKMKYPNSKFFNKFLVFNHLPVYCCWSSGIKRLKTVFGFGQHRQCLGLCSGVTPGSA